jgi:hypothetical protein
MSGKGIEDRSRSALSFCWPAHLVGAWRALSNLEKILRRGGVSSMIAFGPGPGWPVGAVIGLASRMTSEQVGLDNQHRYLIEKRRIHGDVNRHS